MKFIELPTFYEELGTKYQKLNFDDPLRQDTLNAYPSVFEYINRLSTLEKNIIIEYMKKSKIVYNWMDLVKDPVSNDADIYVGTKEWSDGVFIWRDMHIHLVEKYNLDLPLGFKKHILSFNGKYPHLENLCLDNLIKMYDIENYDFTKAKIIRYN